MWLTLFIIAVVACFFGRNGWRRHTTLNKWRKTLVLDKHQAVFKRLYADIDGFALSKIARLDHDAIDYVYGEIEFESFIALLSLCKPTSATVFYDLGSGTGKAVLACAMVYDVQKSCGIELFPILHSAAVAQQQRLHHLPDYQTKATRVEFRQGNILEAKLSDASLVFINATAFFGETWLAISKHVEQIRPGAYLISTSKALRSELFVTKTVTQASMSWGVVKAFIQQRL